MSKVSPALLIGDAKDLRDAYDDDPNHGWFHKYVSGDGDRVWVRNGCVRHGDKLAVIHVFAQQTRVTKTANSTRSPRKRTMTRTFAMQTDGQQ